MTKKDINLILQSITAWEPAVNGLDIPPYAKAVLRRSAAYAILRNHMTEEEVFDRLLAYQS